MYNEFCYGLEQGLEATFRLQYLVLCMRIHTCGWYATNLNNKHYSINLRHIYCTIT